ncbi:acyltransferase family protein [Amycolatopsis sp. cmx-4-68]|uniref:acyltransferase family protein n=1 Tax=Amycolatopsis sp. cmx-4-68 TaxID=2790938 RepID=UPI00397CA603
MTPPPPGVRRLPTLTGLRFAAAALVLLGHLNLSPAFVPPARIAVSFFFVLSGFVLTWSARENDPLRRFWRRRFWKILPNHVVTWGLMLAVVAVSGLPASPALPPGATPPASAVANLALLHAWFPATTLLSSVNPVSWSLCSELLFYALFPAILPLVLRIPARRLGVAAAAVVVLTWLVPVAALLFSGPVHVPGSPGMPVSQYWFAYYFPPSRLPEFLLGMVLARMVHSGLLPRIGVTVPSLGIGVLLAAATAALPLHFTFAAATIIPVALVVLGAAAMDVRGVRSFWNLRATVFLGEISFALYLVHPPVIVAYNRLVGGPSRAAIGVAGTGLVLATLCLLAAWALHRFVERPLMWRFGSGRAFATSRDTVRALAKSGPARL